MGTVDDRVARADRPSAEALRLHRFYQGKVQTMARCAIRSLDDLSIWYSPGVAAPCKAIAADRSLVYEFTNKGNTVAVVSDGTRVLGLGNIGPEAGMPVMEGKALLFKYLGGVDAVPICLKTTSADDIIQTVRLIQPCYGGINLEDISQPKCFTVLDTLRADPEVEIPVFHDDQQGTATVMLAGLLNALKVVGRDRHDVRIALIGMGAANVATLRLLLASGVSMSQIVASDSRGILHRERDDVREQQADYPDKWRLCLESNPDDVRGGIAEALRHAHVCIALAQPGPGTIKPEWVAGMEREAIVFPCSNPVPEIWPWEAKEAGARIVGTGRSDFPNQLNNSLGFPAIFRGALDVRARSISDEMCTAAAHEIARYGEELGLDEDHIVPTMADAEVYPREALAVGLKAMEQGLAGLALTREELERVVRERIVRGREMIEAMMRAGEIASPPEE